ncbi:MAG TPA: helix-turn-helix domain-containing protein [Noviherbaspirillum sp.]|uniref:AraC family transcriptional regulator n=1 Tax=Noviherbaspirillum sp. TaxID=1926288 RepID=UPI002DDCB47D|nr:helix-turn-helix domain-containing protein [Noviherbaspirillum sp.]HEV2612326.1 helix-turn-helix domain-containing protein [Noviherbaspirillum sp.]
MIRQVVSPRQELRPYLRNIMVGGFALHDVHLPATSDVQLVIYLRGRAALVDAVAAPSSLPVAFIAGPSSGPRIFRVEPDSRFVAVTFRPSGLVCCLGMPANLFSDQLVSLDDALPRHKVTVLLERLMESRRDEEIIEQIEGFLLEGLLAGLGRSSVLPKLSLDHVLLPASELAGGLAMSIRQLERRFLINYGLSLRDYRRLARFSNALGRLIQHVPRTGELSRIAHDAGYVDQAHFIRDFRQFVGDTPGQFVKARDASESIYHFWQLRPDELASYLD